MSHTPADGPVRFFVPPCETDEESEKLYEALAAFAQCVPAEPGLRIRTIEFEPSRGEHWTATVGERLVGTKSVKQKRRGGTGEVDRRLRDSVVVQAIFAGSPYTIVTDGKPLGNVTSEWHNPIMATESPRTIVYFD